MIALLIAGGAVYLALGDWREALILLVFANLSSLSPSSGNADRARPGRASGPDEPARAGHPRRRAQANPGPRGGARRHRRAFRGRSRSRRCGACRMRGPAGRRIAADRRVRAGAKGRRANRSPDRGARPGGDNSPYVFSGSLVVRGAGIAEVIATGAASEIGKIGQSLSTLETGAAAPANADEPACAHVRHGRRRRHRSRSRALRDACAATGSTRCSAASRSGCRCCRKSFRLSCAVFMAMGAWRISRARVLTRRAAAIETLGSATVLCTDKTGTLTENRMTITRAASARTARRSTRDGSADASVPDAFQDLIEVGVLASAREPFDPMEKAFHALRRKRAVSARGGRRPPLEFVRAYGLRPDLLAVTQVWRPASGGSGLIVATQRRPEAIATLCRIDGAQLER